MSFKNQREALNDTVKAEFIFPIHEIDSFNGGELKNYVISASDEVDGVVINFSDITYLNSSGLRELIQILKILKEKDKPLIFTNVNEDIHKIFVHTNLNRLFTIVESDDAAREALLK